MASSDTYGYSLEAPIRVGGGAVGWSRATLYLEALRGPGGEGVEFQRLGTQVSSEGHLVDVYELLLDGSREPFRVFVDQYSFAAPSVPVGLTCAHSISLPPPESLD